MPRRLFPCVDALRGSAAPRRSAVPNQSYRGEGQAFFFLCLGYSAKGSRRAGLDSQLGINSLLRYQTYKKLYDFRNIKSAPKYSWELAPPRLLAPDGRREKRMLLSRRRKRDRGEAAFASDAGPRAHDRMFPQRARTGVPRSGGDVGDSGRRWEGFFSLYFFSLFFLLSSDFLSFSFSTFFLQESLIPCRFHTEN